MIGIFLEPTPVINNYSNTLEIIDFLGDIWGFISIIIVIAQWITNKQLKNQIRLVLQNTENAFSSILNEASSMSDTAPGDYDSKIAGIRTNAERGKDQISNTIDTILK